MLFTIDLPFVYWFAGIAGTVESEYKETMVNDGPDPITGLTPQEEVSINSKRTRAIFWEATFLYVFLLMLGFATTSYLTPKAEQFKQTYRLVGTFDYSGIGKSRNSSSYLKIGNKHFTIECGLSIFGTVRSCGNERIQDVNVQVELTNFRSIFGLEDTVVSMSTMDGKAIFVRSAEQLVTDFHDGSNFKTYLYGILISVVYYLTMLQSRTRYVRRYNYY